MSEKNDKKQHRPEILKDIDHYKTLREQYKILKARAHKTSAEAALVYEDIARYPVGKSINVKIDNKLEAVFTLVNCYCRDEVKEPLYAWHIIWLKSGEIEDGLYTETEIEKDFFGNKNYTFIGEWYIK